MQPADHYIPDTELFRPAAICAAQAADKGYIVTFGLAPTGPDTSYGYIDPGNLIDDCNGAAVVRRFVEKPTADKAAKYLQQGFLWNSGIFAFRPSVLLEEMRTFEPAIAAAVERAGGAAQRDGDVVRLDAFLFAQSPKKSLDYAVMERTDKAAVVAADFPWSDLGAWSAIYGAHAKDADLNVVSGERAIIIDSQRCFVRSTAVPVAVIGLTDVGIIAEPDGIVVCKLDASASVKKAVDLLRSGARPEALRRTKSQEIYRDYPDLKKAGHRLGRWLDNSALPLWWTAGADHARGGYFELLDEQGRAVPAARRVRVQARQAYVYASAEMAGWQGPWRVATAQGLDALRSRYRGADGLYRTLADDDGAPLDDRTFLYDQAFVLLALATAAKAGVNTEACIAEGRSLRSLLYYRFARDGGGFLEQELRGSRFQSNPHMHLLEAALAWCGADADGQWEELAESIVQLCLDKFVDAESGLLREFFDETGAPAVGFPGRIIEPGHQFEWAWLLSTWSQSRENAAAGAAAARLLEIAERYGIDAVRGVAIDVLLADMSPHSRQARLWPQTERLKAALALATAHPEQRQKYEATALAAVEGLSHYLHTPIPGLWHDKLRPDGTFVVEPSPASSLYHIAGAINALRQYVS
jgi:mannose/cellobiose epimerase-like protein (N-acyl-D-glucosamine 2-epimerase family)